MKVRILAAVALLPLLLLVVLWAPQIFTGILFAAMAAVGAYELMVGTGLAKAPRLFVYGGVMAFWCVLWSGLGIGQVWLLLGIFLYWCVLMLEVMASQMKIPFNKIAVSLVAGVILPLLLGSLVRIHRNAYGRFFILIPFVLAFLSDTGAYFAGIKFGKRKLAPLISPKKSVEGVVGGVVGAMIGLLVYCIILQTCFDFRIRYWLVPVYGLLGSLGGVFGDLCFSVIKRQTGIKDYGNLIPGHGGILDRFDSMMVVGPMAEILLILLPVAVK